MYWIKKCLMNYANFNGRARRKEFWTFNLVYNIVLSILYILYVRANAVMMANYFMYGYDESSTGTIKLIGVLMGIWGLGLFLPAVAVHVRRWHDIGKSGWFVFINAIPLIGWLYGLLAMMTPGNIGSNMYGEDPMDLHEDEY